ncbi:GNAT family N-acetyltransferase [Rubritalea marina]|uniref:GNAT family N-acetyltransferase n=1 Tax=Rubritalea marina TaxID=361055 RepID=UPI0003650F20|nr:GNAT family N-acetyltransferase [Rubritalea marina]
MSSTLQQSTLSSSNDLPRVQTATIEDLDQITDLLTALFEQQGDFTSDPQRQREGVSMILEQPARGRIFVLRNDDQIFGMVNLLFTISTAMGGMVLILEDFIMHPSHRGQGYGTLLLDHVSNFAKQKNFARITLLTDKISEDSQRFFQKHGFAHSSMIPMRLNID